MFKRFYAAVDSGVGPALGVAVFGVIFIGSAVLACVAMLLAKVSC